MNKNTQALLIFGKELIKKKRPIKKTPPKPTNNSIKKKPQNPQLLQCLQTNHTEKISVIVKLLSLDF